MKAMVINKIVSLLEDEAPLELVELPTPEPKPGEVRLKVSACGVCHTELDEIEGRTAPPVFPVVPGHEVIGRGDGMSRYCGIDPTHTDRVPCALLEDKVGIKAYLREDRKPYIVKIVEERRLYRVRAAFHGDRGR